MRIARAHRNRESFRVIVVMPLLPSFPASESIHPSVHCEMALVVDEMLDMMTLREPVCAVLMCNHEAIIVKTGTGYGPSLASLKSPVVDS